MAMKVEIPRCEIQPNFSRSRQERFQKVQANVLSERIEQGV